MTSRTPSRHSALPNGPLGLTIRRVAVVFSTSLLLACGGGESADRTDTSAMPTVSAAGPSDACELLPAADASTVFGETVRDSVALLMSEGDRILSQCNYASASNPVVGSLMIRRSAPGETVEQGSKGAREAMTQSGGTVEDVPGLGAAAFWVSGQLHVWTDNGWYLIASPSASGGLTQARAMVEKAIARL
ncbi:MAG: hypothetical protein K0S86_1869 [Geminicoccaceae bacterium]|nr:hypothetical protein [Geminicoccaceae bacterium]